MSDELRSRLSAAIGERYEIADEIGRGGMGVVFRARDVRLRRSVAIKLLPPELAFRDEVRSRFLREAQTAAQLSHPNVVPIYSVDEVDGLVFFVMALIDGESLAVQLKRDRRVSIDFARRVLKDVADALAYAHARSIIHRDIKPDNILLDRVTGRTVVSDFGIARAAEGDSRLTVTGVAVGTPAYMSPEQAMGEREIDGRSDLYSLGVVGYQMLTGELPFSATNTPSMLMKHISDHARPIRELRPDVPPGLEHGIERAMEKQPDGRWPNAAAFRDALSDDSPRSRPAARSAASPASAPLPTGRSNAGAERAPWSAQPASVHEAIRNAPRPNADRPPHAPPAAGAQLAQGKLPAWMPPPAQANPPSLPPIPAWMPSSWGDVRHQKRAFDRDQRRVLRHQMREQAKAHAELARRGGGDPAHESPVEYRIRAFRMHVARVGTSAAVLAGINMVTSPFVPWFLVPAAFMSLSVLRRGGALWAEGVRMRDVFGKDARLPATAGIPPHWGAPALGASAAHMAAQRIANRAASLVPPEVLHGPHGANVRRAVEDQASIVDAIAKLPKTDREMIPDVSPTVDSLVDRVAGLAVALHRIDDDVTPETIARIDDRIAAATAEPETNEREKKLTLLRRQRATLDDLLGRREGLVAQLDSASLMLQNIRLDLIALRNAGVQSSIDDVSSATQEARALSRDIGHVLEAAKQVRD
jgi:serine/threonine protein kinase